MDDRTMPSTFADLIATRFLPRDLTRNDSHIVDQLIAERAAGLSSHPLWPLMRPLLYGFLHYSEAVRMADRIEPLSGRGVLDFVSDLLALDIQTSGVDNIPATGGFIMACSHPLYQPATLSRYISRYFRCRCPMIVLTSSMTFSVEIVQVDCLTAMRQQARCTWLRQAR